jgi:hypothetical protein
MTQFQPPPPPPQGGYASPASYGPPGLPPWSIAAIAGFVLSLLGFLGVTAVLGLILGIVGIITTGDGRRRGRGLAIAAIPISVVTGAIFVLLLAAILFFLRAAELPIKLQSALAADSSSLVGAADTLRELGSAKFNDEVSAEAMQAWLKQINAKHGKLTSAKLDTDKMVSWRPDGATSLNVSGKFVNGPALIQLVFSKEKAWSLRIDDIDIGGSSPRGSADAPSPTRKDPAP